MNASHDHSHDCGNAAVPPAPTFVRLIVAIVVAVASLAGSFASIALAQEPSQPAWIEHDTEGGKVVHLYFYWSATCPHCQEARPFITAIPHERPWVRLHSLEVSRSRDNARRFEDMALTLGRHAEVVPTLIYCGRMDVGWQDAATTGADLLAGLDACRVGQGVLMPDAEPLKLPFFGRVDPGALSLPLVTVVIAALDAFNPCAFFVLLFLLSLIAHQHDRRRMLTIGGVFIAASGLMYFAFMAAWLNVFQLLDALTWITLAAGMLASVVGVLNIKDFFAFGRGLSLSIPDAAKPSLYRRTRAILQSEHPVGMIAATLLLAIAANFYELLCTAGFPMVYTRILTLNEPSVAGRYAWLALYNAIYVVPLALIVLAFVGVRAVHKLTEREGRLLKLLSGTMMLELGVVLATHPAWLNSPAVTAALIGVALAVTLAAASLTKSP